MYVHISLGGGIEVPTPGLGITAHNEIEPLDLVLSRRYLPNGDV